MATSFEKKCAIIAEAVSEFEDDPEWETEFREYDLGYTYAFGLHHDHITLKEEGVSYVERTWKHFCERLEVDPEGDYSALAIILDPEAGTDDFDE